MVRNPRVPGIDSPAQRLRYAALALGTIALGLLIHRGPLPLGVVTRDVLGDALWAAMVVWWISALAPGVHLVMRSGVALAVSFMVELSQLYHAPALDALRSTTAGHLVLGNGFDPRDLAAYAAGVAVAALCDHVMSGSRLARAGEGT